MTSKPQGQREPRIETESALPVYLRAGAKLQSGFLLDISATGAFVLTDLVLPDGQIVTLELELPGSERPERLQGVIARRENTRGKIGLGIEFLSRSDDERRHIDRVVSTILTLELLGPDPVNGA